VKYSLTEENQNPTQVRLSANAVYFGLELSTAASNSGSSACKFLTQDYSNREAKSGVIFIPNLMKIH
jgi:hypothetical protein